jgi:hypothetical protein
MTAKITKKRIAFNYLSALIAAVVLWNLIISNFIFNQSSDQESSLAYGNVPYSRFVNGGEGFSSIRVNNFGYNNDFIDVNKDDNYRIVVLGDSVTSASQLPRKNNYTTKLKDKLNKDGGNNEVYNFGKAGRRMADYLAFAEDYKKILKPDYFIIQLEADDFLVKNPDLFVVKKHDDIFSLEKTEKSGYFNKLKDIKNKTGWFQQIFLYTAIDVSKTNVIAKLKTAINYINTIVKTRDIEVPEINPNTIVNDSEDLIDWQLKELITAYGDNIVILMVSNTPIIKDGKVIYEDKQNELKTLLKSKILENKIKLIDTENIFNEYYDRTNKFARGFNENSPGTGHLNIDGHEIVAEELFNYFNELVSKTKLR